jgi:hypothetical protein
MRRRDGMKRGTEGGIWGSGTPEDGTGQAGLATKHTKDTKGKREDERLAKPQER